MKLVDLLEANIAHMLLGVIPVIKRKDGDGVVDLTKLKHLGSGVEGDVYAAKKHGVAIKVVRFNLPLEKLEQNPFINYVALCLQNKQNPYFPRFQSVKIYEASPANVKHPQPPNAEHSNEPEQRAWHANGEHDWICIAVMEQLEELDDLPIEKAESLFNLIGATLDLDGKGKVDSKTGQKYESVRRIGIGSTAINNIIKNTKDENLHDVLSKLQPLFDKFGYDVRMSNFMLRRHGSKYQLVFTDPLDPDGKG